VRAGARHIQGTLNGLGERCGNANLVSIIPTLKLKAEFAERMRNRFYDPAFDPLKPQIEAIVDTAWRAYDEYRKSPRTRRAGAAFADPDAELSTM